MRPDDDHHSYSKVPECYDADFAVVVTVVDEVEGLPFEHLGRIIEVDRPLGQRLEPLPRIVGDLHRLDNVYTLNAIRKATEAVA